MSIRVMTLVWDKFNRGGSEKLAMLAMADWCNDEGGDLYPSIARVAEKINVSESQARRILHKFIDEGLLQVVGNANGGKAGSTRRYQLSIAALNALGDGDATGSTGASRTGGTDATRTGSTHARGTGSTHARDGSHPCAETGSTHATLSVIEPSVNRQPAPRARAPAGAREDGGPDEGDLLTVADALRLFAQYGVNPQLIGSGSRDLQLLKSWRERGVTFQRLADALRQAARVRDLAGVLDPLWPRVVDQHLFPRDAPAGAGRVSSDPWDSWSDEEREAYKRQMIHGVS